MGQLNSNDLLPGVEYYVQIRAMQDTTPGEWSASYSFVAGKDTVPPNPVTNLQGSISGTSMIVSWDAPTQNVDGTSLLDFGYYLVYVTNGIYFAEFQTPDTTFELTYESNQNVFGGDAVGDVTFTVYAVDNVGNYSTDAPSVSIVADPPPPITSLSATAQQDAIQVSFDAPTSGTWSYYEVFFSTGGSGGPWTSVYKGNGTNLFIPDTNYAATWVAVDTVSAFNLHTRVVDPTSVTPRSSFTVDTTPPANPTAFTVVGAIDQINIGAIAATATWTQTVPTENDLAGFNIRYRKSGATNWNYLNISDPAARTATISNLASGNPYDFQINSYDFAGNASGWVAATMAAVSDTTAPSKPASPTIATSTLIAQVTISGNKASGGAMEADVDHYEVYLSSTTGFVTSPTNFAGIIPVGPAMANTFPVPASAASGTAQTWYAKIIAVDFSGNKSPESDQSSASVPLIASTNIQDATITNAKIHDLGADKLTAGLGIINALSVKNVLTVDTAGLVNSLNYAAGVSGWQLSNNALEINQGSISAAALRLQVGANIVPNQYADFEWQSTFYNSQFVTSNAPTVSIDPTAFINTQSLKVVTGGTAPTIDFTPSATTYNFPVESGSTYIVSLYVTHNSASAQNFNIRFKDDVSAVLTSGNLSVPAGTTYTRISTTFTTGLTASKAWIGIQLPASITVNIDAVQVEKQLTGSTAPSAWRPSSLTSIDGGMIKTGSIQSTNLVATGQSSGTQPQWSINLAGNATFANALVRGHLIVGDSSGNGLTTDQYLSSPGYTTNASAGTGGWIIRGDGYAEFARAALIGSAGNITLTIGTAPNVLKVDSSGLYIGANTFGAAPFRIDYAGNGYFKGTLDVNSSVPGSTVSGKVGSASNLDNGTVTGSNNITGLITVGSGNNRAEIGTAGALSGIRLYGPDPVTAVAGTLLVDLNTNGTATFKGTVVSSIFTTATTGNRVRIEPSGTYGNQIQIWGGGTGENGPGIIYGGNGLFGDMITINSPTVAQTNGSNQAGIGLFPGSSSYPNGFIWQVGTTRFQHGVEILSGIVFNDSSGLAQVGYVNSPNAISTNATWNFNIPGANNVGILLNGASGQNVSYLRAVNSGGTMVANISASGNVQGWGTYTNLQPSELSYKRDVEYMPYSDALNRLNNIKPAKWYYTNDDPKRYYGFVVDNLAEIFPEAVVPLEDGRRSYAEAPIVGLLVEGFHALTAEINDLKTRLDKVATKE